MGDVLQGGLGGVLISCQDRAQIGPSMQETKV